MTSTDTVQQPQGVMEVKDIQHGGKKLFEAQMEQFRKLASKDLEDAFERYGFALFHSTTPEEQALIREQLGIKCQDANDFYDLGIALASKEEYAKAIIAWNQALKMDPKMANAIYNIAVANERMNNLSAARNNYKKYIDSIEETEEIERIKQHLAEIGD